MRAVRVVAAIVLAAGCRSSSGGGARTVTVDAFGGDRAEPGATVISHRGNGTIIDRTTADAVGRAAVDVDDDAYISVVFPGNISAVTPVLSVVTVAAPESELRVHGPARSLAPPLIVGVLQVDGPNLPAADYFDIRIGCATARVTDLPASMDIGACSMGSDMELDVIVMGYHDVGGDPPAPMLDGYAAGRVSMANGIATLDIASWRTTGTAVPVTLDGVDPVIEMSLYADGLLLSSQHLTGGGTLWTGLTVDATRVTAALSGIGAARITTREIAGTPASIDLAATDFLPPVSVTAVLETMTPATISWEPAAIGDAVNLHASWDVGGSVLGVVPTGPHRVVWDAVLPPDAAMVALPALDDELGTAIAPLAIVPTDIVVRYIDSPALDGFAALVAAGVHAEETLQTSTIAPRPTSGDIRVSHAVGLR